MTDTEWKFRIQKVFGKETQYRIWPANTREPHIWRSWKALDADQQRAVGGKPLG